MTARAQDILERVIKTFVQAALAVLIPTLIAYFNGIITVFTPQVILFPAIAAGLSALWNTFFPNKTQRNISEVQDAIDHTEEL